MSNQKSHKKVFIIGGIGAGIMFAFCFAMVPLYSLICKKTGITTAITTDLITAAQADAIGKEVDKTREVTIQFTATNHMGMPWAFFPMQKSMKIYPGEKNTIYFRARNPTGKDMVAQAIPGMTPGDAISHFHKIECFCFNQLKLKAGEGSDMALVFQVDKDLPKNVHVITLAYTLYDATPKNYRKESHA